MDFYVIEAILFASPNFCQLYHLIHHLSYFVFHFVEIIHKDYNQVSNRDQFIFANFSFHSRYATLLETLFVLKGTRVKTIRSNFKSPSKNIY